MTPVLWQSWRSEFVNRVARTSWKAGVRQFAGSPSTGSHEVARPARAAQHCSEMAGVSLRPAVRRGTSSCETAGVATTSAWCSQIFPITQTTALRTFADWSLHNCIKLAKAYPITSANCVFSGPSVIEPKARRPEYLAFHPGICRLVPA